MKKGITIWVLWCFMASVCQWSLAQQDSSEVIHHLKVQLQHAELEATRLALYVRISAAYLNSQPDSSLQYTKVAEQLAIEMDNSQWLGESKKLIGENLLNQGIYNQAIHYFLEAEQQFKSANTTLLLADNYSSLGIAYQYSQQIETAQQYFELALQLFKEEQNKKGMGEAYGNIGHVYEKKGDYQKALQFQNKALQLYELLHDKEAIAVIYDNLGSIYEDLENYDSAYHYFEASAQINRATNNQTALVISLNNVGDTFRKKGEYTQALYYTKQSLALARTLQQKYQIRSSFRDLAKIYRELGDFELAYQYMDSTYEYSGELFNKQIADQIAQLQTLYETQQKEQEIALLENQKKTDRMMRYGFIAGIVLIFLIAYIIIKQQRSKIRQDKELIEKRQKVHEAQQELTKAELRNTQLKEQALQTELENKQLKELQLNQELAVKDKEMTTRALHIIQKNKMLKELQNKIEEIKKNSNGSVKKKEINKLAKLIDYSFSFDKDWKDFQQSFEHVHADFFKSLKNNYPDLTPSELRLCALLKLNLNSKDIATILGISQDSLRIARYRLRKKIELPKGSNLMAHIMEL